MKYWGRNSPPGLERYDLLRQITLMLQLKISTGRGVTLPKQLCESLEISPGDTLQLERAIKDGRKFWLLARTRKSGRPWRCSLRKYAASKGHGSKAIRKALPQGNWPSCMKLSVRHQGTLIQKINSLSNAMLRLDWE